jgi:hypothetical protein
MRSWQKKDPFKQTDKYRLGGKAPNKYRREDDESTRLLLSVVIRRIEGRYRAPGFRTHSISDYVGKSWENRDSFETAVDSVDSLTTLVSAAASLPELERCPAKNRLCDVHRPPAASAECTTSSTENEHHATNNRKSTGGFGNLIMKTGKAIKQNASELTKLFKTAERAQAVGGPPPKEEDLEAGGLTLEGED